jgi:hypothetical protein
VIGGVACLLIIVLIVLYRRRQQRKPRLMVDEPADYVPAGYALESEVIRFDPPSRFQGKAGSSYTLSPPGLSGPPSMNALETSTFLGNITPSDGWHSRNPSDSHLSDSTGRVQAAIPSTFLHQDSGARLPSAAPPLVDIPPAYTQNI